MKRKVLSAALFGILAAVVGGGMTVAALPSETACDSGYGVALDGIYEAVSEEDLTNSLGTRVYFGSTGSSKRLWKIMGVEDESLVLMQEPIYETLEFDINGVNRWRDSSINAYLQSAEFAGNFTEAELVGISRTQVEVKDELGEEAVGYGSKDARFYLPGVVADNQITWSSHLAGDTAKTVGGVIDNIAYTSDNPETEKGYWLRSPKSDRTFQAMYIGSAGYVYSGINVRGSGKLVNGQYKMENLGIRPVCKVGLDQIASFAQSGEGDILKMTVMAGVDSQNPYQISDLRWKGASVSKGQTIEVQAEEVLSLELAAVFPEKHETVFSAYRIIRESDGKVVSSDVFGKTEQGMNAYTIPLKTGQQKLAEGYYKVYLWIFGEQATVSNEASAPWQFVVKYGEPKEEPDNPDVPEEPDNPDEPDNPEEPDNPDEGPMAEVVTISLSATKLYWDDLQQNTATAHAIITPTDVKGCEVVWKSQNEEVVRVESHGIYALLTAKQEGSAAILVTVFNCDGTEQKAEVIVEVKTSVSGDGGNSNGGSSSGGSSHSTSSVTSAKGSFSGPGGVWVADEKGWWFRYPDGSWPHSSWMKDREKWYYFDETGYMKTGWLFDQENWYFLNEAGDMVENGWVLYLNKWYYLGEGGKMASNTVTPDGYLVGADGAWIPDSSTL